MKITHIISDSNIGGAGVQLSMIAKSLADDFDIEVIIPKGSMLLERFRVAPIKLTQIPVTGDKSFDIKDIFTFYRYFKENRPDIVHTHASLSARLGARLAGVRFCLSTRHCATEETSVKLLPLPLRLLYGFCTDITVSTADFATGNLIKSGVDPKKIVTIKNGSAVPNNESALTRGELLSSLGIDGEVKIIGSCARLEAVKGQDVILRAAAQILSKRDDVHFLFLGEGSKLDEYKSLSAALGIAEHVSFLGFVDNVRDYQRLFYINVNASRGTETSCLAISECMAIGIPTVASDFGGNREMIRDGIDGLIFQRDNHFALCDCILRLLDDKALYTDISREAKTSYFDNFSMPTMTKKYKDLYKSLLFAKKIDKSLPHMIK